MTTIIQKKRFLNEIKILNNEPLHYCTAYPEENNFLVWYFIIKGQKDTDYEGGEYIGKIIHSPKYPTEPPDYNMLTPNGRFTTNQKICVTNSSYHKSDWSSTWNIKTILIGFYSIWLDDSEHGISHIKCSSVERKKLALESIEYNIKNHNDIYSKFNLAHLTTEFINKKDNIKENDNTKNNTKVNNEENINDNIKDNEDNEEKKINSKIIIDKEENEVNINENLVKEFSDMSLKVNKDEV